MSEQKCSLEVPVDYPPSAVTGSPGISEDRGYMQIIITYIWIYLVIIG